MTLQRMASHRRGEKITDAAKILGTLQKHSLSGSTAQRNAATIFLMEAQHGFRIGSYEKTLGSVKSFGTSTLLGKHITKTYTKMDKRGRKHYMVTFSFPGKNGHMHDEQVDSRAFYERVHAFKRRGGRDNDRIFQDPVRDGNGRKVYQPVTWKSVHRYMDSLTKKNSPNRIKTLAKPLEDGVINKYSGKKENQRYTSHDFRRYFATEMARKEIKNWIARNKGARPNSAEQYKALKDDVLGKVSKKLRNSPKVAESHYILETLWDRLQVPGVKDLKAQGVNAKKSMDDDGIDFWDSMSDMFDHTHLAGVDDYEDEEDEKEENKEENNKNEIPSESTDKGIEEIRERIGKMLQKDSEMAEQEDESLWNDAADDPKKIWECTRDSKLKEEKIGEAINVLDSKNLPASDWWCKIDGVGVITGRANQIQAVLDQNVTPSGVQI